MSLRNTAAAVTVAVLAAIGVFAGGASSSSSVSADTTTTATMPQKSGLPPPYNQEPKFAIGVLGGGKLVRGQTTLNIWQVHGVVKVLRVYLQINKRGTIRLLKDGTTRYTMTELGPVWTLRNLHNPLGSGAQITVRYRVLPNAPLANVKHPYCYTMLFRGSNGRLTKSDPATLCFRVTAKE